MPGILTFIVDDTLKAIVEHARTSPSRNPSYDELYDPACRKDGKEPEDGTFPTVDDVDPDKIPFGIWLVKDRGVYLMSPGNPNLKAPTGDESLVAYAIEANPNDDDCWETARSIMGGDDCVEKIDLPFFERAIARGMTRIVIAVTDAQISLGAEI